MLSVHSRAVRRLFQLQSRPQEAGGISHEIQGKWEVEGGQKKMEKLIAHAKEGGVVAVTRVVFHNRSQFSFKAMGQKTFVPLGLAQALRLQFLKKINIVYDISHREQHHTPYACKSKDGDPSSHLGIKLEGRHCGGVNEGLEFGKWIKCNSLQAVTKADRIVSLMLGNG